MTFDLKFVVNLNLVSGEYGETNRWHEHENKPELHLIEGVQPMTYPTSLQDRSRSFIYEHLNVSCQSKTPVATWGFTYIGRRVADINQSLAFVEQI